MPTTEITNQELRTIAADLEAAHDPEMILAASTYHLASMLLQHYGDTNGVSLAPQITLLKTWIDAWLRDNGTSAGSYLAALASLRRAGRTVQVINAIPA